MRELKHEIDRLKIRLRELWGASCEQVVEHDKEISSKDEEIASLKERLSRLALSLELMKSPSVSGAMYVLQGILYVCEE